MKLSGIMLGTENPAKLAEFYTKVFGEPSWHQDDWYGYKVGGNDFGIGPHSEVIGPNSSPARIMIMLVTDEVEKEFARIKELGAQVVAEPYHPGDDAKMMLATLADPDNNYFQLATPWEA